MSLECSKSLEADLKVAALRKRAEYLHKARSFFLERSVVEVDTPSLCQFPAIDSAIQVMEVGSGHECRYLHTSPEYGMKRLLSLGMGDIYQLSHVFRKDECGVLHNPEFTMCEWYRMGWGLEAYIEEVIAFIGLFVGSKKKLFLTYEEAFQRYLQVSSEKSSLEELLLIARKRGCSSSLSRDEVLDFLFGELEKELPLGELVIVRDFPPSKAALSEVTFVNGTLVAKRFEIFYRGIEIANGYKELTDPLEQKNRLESEARKYQEIHQKKLPIDTLFIEALQEGMPSCCGVACGFDRLVMLALNANDLSSILPWAWEKA